MDKPKLYKKIKRGKKKSLTRKACGEWHDNHTRNPLTNRVIKPNGRVYRKLKKTCDNLEKNSIELNDHVFIRESAEGDGNCFFNSVIMLIYPDHLPVGLDVLDNSTESGHVLREFLADMLTMKDYVNLLEGTYARTQLNIEYPYKRGDENLTVSQLMKKQKPELKREMKAKIKQDFKDFKEMFSDCSLDADEAMIDFTARKLRLNIIVYNTATNQFTSSRKIIKNRSSIFVYNRNLVHFDPLRGDDGERVWKWKVIGKDIESL